MAVPNWVYWLIGGASATVAVGILVVVVIFVLVPYIDSLSAKPIPTPAPEPEKPKDPPPPPYVPPGKPDEMHEEPTFTKLPSMFHSLSRYQELIDNYNDVDGWNVTDPVTKVQTNERRNHAIWIIAQSKESPFSKYSDCYPAIISKLQGMSDQKIYDILTTADFETIKSNEAINPLIGADKKCPV